MPPPPPICWYIHDGYFILMRVYVKIDLKSTISCTHENYSTYLAWCCERNLLSGEYKVMYLRLYMLYLPYFHQRTIPPSSSIYLNFEANIKNTGNKDIRTNMYSSRFFLCAWVPVDDAWLQYDALLLQYMCNRIPDERREICQICRTPLAHRSTFVWGGWMDV